jgi:hypothetical protein
VSVAFLRYRRDIIDESISLVYIPRSTQNAAFTKFRLLAFFPQLPGIAPHTCASGNLTSQAIASGSHANERVFECRLSDYIGDKPPYLQAEPAGHMGHSPPPYFASEEGFFCGSSEACGSCAFYPFLVVANCIIYEIHITHQSYGECGGPFRVIRKVDRRW